MTMQTIAEYAKEQKVSTRTVERWLAAGRLPEAVKVNDAWLIPHDATPDGAKLRQERAAATPGSGVAVRQAAALPALPAPPANLAEALARETAYLSLTTAARLLGVAQEVILDSPDEFGARPYGRRNAHGQRALRVPAATVRKAAGI